jgi:hypothetical protein
MMGIIGDGVLRRYLCSGGIIIIDNVHNLMMEQDKVSVWQYNDDGGLKVKIIGTFRYSNS